MTSRLDISHREDKTGLEVQMSQLTDASGNTALVSDIVAGNIAGTQTVLPKLPYATVAAAGSTVADATPVVSGFTVVTAADGTKGVVLPTSPAAGTQVILKNNAGSILKVWPDAAATINAIGSNSDLAVAANCPVHLIASSATQWWSLPLLPS